MAPRSVSVLAAGLAGLAAAQPGGCPNGGIANVHWNETLAQWWADQPITNTSKTGRKLRLLEPPDGSCLHGAGQDPFSFSNYVKFMSNTSTPGAGGKKQR